ncbi:TolC family protein [Rickettsia endosymbiont of Cardiosporidium cionae]|uniref:TolC family protein n=1 Tax=Rickettsia endosymbiont of Cardiosporidium cionae TaxID=2777155 RepID=UPI0018949E0F|nr:TolC family protein [Rickettsia endosymbiont of Cardiosporidium cionae]KAF8818275.1 TolC family protein [Rickettsia endosymbiont of Cardiosporidium cionae]
MTLEEAINYSYSNNEIFRINKLNFLIALDNKYEVVAEFMPKVMAQHELYNKQSGKGPNFTNQTKSNSSLVRLDHVFFSGGSSVAKLQSSKVQSLIAKEEYYSKEQTVLLELIKTYLEVLAKTMHYDITNQTVANHNKILNVVNTRYSLGEATVKDLANAQSAKFSAEAKLAEEFAELKTLKSKFLTSFGIDSENLVMPNDDLGNVLPGTLDLFMDVVLKQNHDLKIAHYKLRKAKSDKYTVVAALSPRVVGSVLWQTKTSTKTGGYNQKFNDRGSTVSLNLDVPIFAGGAEYTRIRQADKVLRSASTSIRYLNKKLHSDTLAIWEKLQALKVRHAAILEAVKAADLVHRSEQEEFNIGSGTKNITDVIESQEKLNNLRKQEIINKISVILAHYEVKSLLGELIGYYMNLSTEYFDPESAVKFN